MTVARAVAFASAVNLGQTDVGSGASRSSGGTVKVTPAAIAAAHCAGGVDPRRWVTNRYSSTYHDPDGGSLRSVVLVWPTVALAAENAKAELSARGRACFLREEAGVRTYRASGVLVRQVLKSVSRLPDPLPVVPEAFEWGTIRTDHASAHRYDGFGRQITLGPETSSSYEDLFGFVVGPAQIWLVSRSLGTITNSTTERDLLRTIYERAVARRLSSAGS